MLEPESVLVPTVIVSDVVSAFQITTFLVGRVKWILSFALFQPAAPVGWVPTAVGEVDDCLGLRTAGLEEAFQQGDPWVEICNQKTLVYLTIYRLCASCDLTESQFPHL